MTNLQNYLPYPLTQYGCSTPQPGDSDRTKYLLADKAAWCVLYLVERFEMDYWHLRPAFTAEQKERRRDLIRGLSAASEVCDLLVDNMLVRHHLLHKTPSEMVEFLLPLDLWALSSKKTELFLRERGEADTGPEADAELEKRMKYWSDYAKNSLNVSRMQMIVEGSRNGRKD